MEIFFPQLEEIRDLLKLLVEQHRVLTSRLDVLSTKPQPDPVQLELPDARPEPEFELPPAESKPRRTPRKASAKVNGSEQAAGADDAVDEEGLRALAAFEAKRVTRSFGIGATRAAVAKVAGPGVGLDDVPPQQLPQLLEALQAL